MGVRRKPVFSTWDRVRSLLEIGILVLMAGSHIEHVDCLFFGYFMIIFIVFYLFNSFHVCHLHFENSDVSFHVSNGPSSWILFLYHLLFAMFIMLFGYYISSYCWMLFFGVPIFQRPSSLAPPPGLPPPLLQSPPASAPAMCLPAARPWGPSRGWHPYVGPSPWWSKGGPGRTYPPHPTRPEGGEGTPSPLWVRQKAAKHLCCKCLKKIGWVFWVLWVWVWVCALVISLFTPPPWARAREVFRAQLCHKNRCLRKEKEGGRVFRIFRSGVQIVRPSWHSGGIGISISKQVFVSEEFLLKFCSAI